MKKINIEQLDMCEMKTTELKEVNGGNIFEDTGIFMGVLLFYESQKLNEKMNYSGMVASFGH